MNLDLFAAASVAILSSFTHCYAMCGGFNIAFARLNATSKHQISLTLVYHFSRIIAYIALGVIFALFGNAIGFINRGFLSFMIGVFMVILGLALIFRGKLLEILETQVFFKLFARRILGKFSLKGVCGACILGFCNGFVPCGLVYFFIALAMNVAFSSIFKAALIMLIFGLCTLPALLFFNALTQILSAKFRKFWAQISYLIIIAYGLYLSYLGFLATR